MLLSASGELRSVFVMMTTSGMRSAIARPRCSRVVPAATKNKGYSNTLQTRTYFSKQRTDNVLINEVLMTFSMYGSYRKGTCYHDEYIAIQYVLNKLE